jgi:putative protease
MGEGSRAGEVTHYYNNISIAIVELIQTNSMGDRLHCLGSHSDFRQTVKSMPVEHEEIETASAGQEVGIKVKQRVCPGDSVFLLEEE